MSRLTHWFKSLCRPVAAVEKPRATSRRRLSWRPAFEILEDRVTPTNWVVSLSTPDSGSTAGTLRYALTHSASGELLFTVPAP